MHFIRFFDFFDIKFHFYYENRLKISIFGGIMSILCLIGSVLTVLLLSIDDIKKLNPKATKSVYTILWQTATRIEKEGCCQMAVSWWRVGRRVRRGRVKKSSRTAEPSATMKSYRRVV